MADYLKSAFSYLTSSASNKCENDFLGSTIYVGPISLRIKRVIAEGGYGVVYEAQDTSKGTCYALKRMLAHDKATNDLILHEIALLKQLSGHPNIMKFFHAASVGKEKLKVVGTEFLIVTELCKGGQLTQYLPTPRHDRPFSSQVILQIMHQTCRAVQHMHSQCPPVVHRDLKIENLLLSEDFVIKLCDFGSASTNCYSPDVSWTALQRLSLQEELEKFTTPMYRAPEMLDLYQNYPIGTASDIWALGCILFYLSCTYHPFEDAAKLAILNANFTLPVPASREETTFQSLIRQMLLIDPRQRPTISDILRELSELASMMEIRVSGSIPILADIQKRHSRKSPSAPQQPVQTTPAPEQPDKELKPTSNRTRAASPRPPTNRSPQQPHAKSHTPARPPPPPPTSPPSSISSPSQPATSVDLGRSQPAPTPTSGAGTGHMFGLLKGGAGSLFRNLRDASNKMLETVSSTLSTDLDFQLITSRIAVMSYPAESGLESLGTGNSMEEVQHMLNTRYPNAYAVYNLSPRPYRSDQWFDGRVSHRVFEAHRAPSLRSLIELCLNARLWLNQKPGNLCVVHCMDGRAASAVLVCSLLCFCHLFDNVSPALQLFSSKRGNPKLNASQIRYIDYVAQLSHSRVPMPHHRPLKLISLTVAPVPTFNKSKNGCRPYVEVYEGKNQVFSTFTDYENLRSYVLEDRKIEFLLNGISVLGDLTVIVYHCRSSFAGRAKVSAVKIAQFQLYTGFIEPDQTELIYFKSDLDHLDTSSGFGNFASRYADSFSVTLEFMVSPNERPRQGKNLVYPWETLPSPESLRPELCVSDPEELRSLLADYGRFNFTQPTTGQSAAVSRQPSATSSDSVHSSKVEAPSAKTPDVRENQEPPIDHLLYPDSQATVNAKHQSETHEHQSDKERTPVADLLGFHIHSPEHNGKPSSTAYSPPTVLVDVDLSTTNESTDHPADTSVVNDDDLFNIGAQPPETSASDWTTAFELNTGPSSNNPFDPFGIPTGEPDLHYASSPSVNQTPVDVSGIKDKPVDLDTIFGAPHMSTSASASDLNPNKTTPLYPSASFSSLSSNAAAQTEKPGRPDPFAEFNLFGQSGTVHPDLTSSSTSTNHMHNIGSTGSFTATKTSRPPPTFEKTQSSRTSFAAGTAPNGPETGTTTAGNAPPPSTPSRTGARPHVRKDAFSDLLGDFSGTSNSASQSQARTVNEMRREKLAKTVDPEQLKVQDWVHGKDRNLRALLCSLPGILWDGVKWKPVGITDLMTPEQVKRQYRNAARVIHPDKWMNTEHEQLARMIFVELNDAMAEFEKESAPGMSF